MSKVGILCRGKSLKEINNMPICDILILINSFKNELDDKDISNYVKKHDNIISFTSLAIDFKSIVEKNIYSEYNFKKIVLPYVRECLPSVPQFLFSIKDKNDTFLPVECMSDNNKPYMLESDRYKFTSPTCGMDSILYAVNDLNAKELFIIGMDFYDGVGYFNNLPTGRNNNGIPISDEYIRSSNSVYPKEGREMKLFLPKFTDKFLDREFNLITCFNYKESKNVKVSVVDKKELK